MREEDGGDAVRIELNQCPFCGGQFKWFYKHSIGKRMIKGYAKCDGCGCKVGDDLVCFEDEDLRERIAEIINNRRTDNCNNCEALKRPEHEVEDRVR